jgi:hypothetical protein
MVLGSARALFGDRPVAILRRGAPIVQTAPIAVESLSPAYVAGWSELLGANPSNLLDGSFDPHLGAEPDLIPDLLRLPSQTPLRRPRIEIVMPRKPGIPRQ